MTMARRKMKEALDNIERVVETKDDNVEIVGGMDIVMADAYADDLKAGKHIQSVKKELDDKAKAVITDSPDTGKEVKNEYTKQLTLDESISSFSLTESSSTYAQSLSDEDDFDLFLDYDMYYFMTGLFTTDQAEYRPLSPNGIKISSRSRFRIQGSDSYLTDDEIGGMDAEKIAAAERDKVPQVGVDGDYLILSKNEVADFTWVRAVCDAYGFEYKGPVHKRSDASKWAFDFFIKIPSYSPGYPMMIEDYFDDKGMDLEDVMPATWCLEYRRRQAIDQDARQVDQIIAKHITDYPTSELKLNDALDALFTELDEERLHYDKKTVKKQFTSEVN